ncbi:hypothetical protein M513_02415 [Trichuris suis]|uniref:Uncharacterized protein n=1 Tax=Trichuris suis TaxID=68888 RepID=A0A085MHP2_9BILA|nr:hypothetical protein M513_02415 [Trichuris suis]
MKCIAHVSCCKRWRRKPVGMTALNGGALLGQGVGTVWLQPIKNLTSRADVVVSRVKPLGFDFIVGMNGIKAPDGVLVDSQGRARFRPSEGTAGAAKEVYIRLHSDLRPRQAILDNHVEMEKRQGARRPEECCARVSANDRDQRTVRRRIENVD